MELQLSEFESPLGLMRVVVGADGLCDLDFADRWETKHRRLERRLGAIRLQPVADAAGVVTRLQAYFEGQLDALDSLPVDPGGTPFQRKVWSALREIPAGATTSYGTLAARVGLSGGARPVGAANGRNPIAIVIPCHRVIGADGSLTGYAGGLARKRWLLSHEGNGLRSATAVWYRDSNGNEDVRLDRCRGSRDRAGDVEDGGVGAPSAR